MTNKHVGGDICRPILPPRYRWTTPIPSSDIRDSRRRALIFRSIIAVNGKVLWH